VSRSLVLAGGGMRVAWQTGVVRALDEAGLAFDHVDGTSGGILTAAMMLSGQRPAQMGSAWSTLDVGGFASPLPLADYLRGPWALPALGDASGLLSTVFPHLGVDVAAIRAAGVSGTFNVCDFVTKTCVAVPHTEVDAPLLAAGMSLPGLMTPLRRGSRVWTDAVWIKDANVTEALRRGADEVWLVWCIGNTPYWGDGPLEQYVHMIEMSAGGALFAELAAAESAGRSFRLHVVKPRHPLPLDPVFLSGRISADTLVAMGYRDAWEYLSDRSAEGVPHDETCTTMAEPVEGVRFTERLRGTVDGSPLTLEATVEMPVPANGSGVDGDEAEPRMVGHVDHAPWGDRVLLAGGRVESDRGAVTYRARILVGGAWREFAVRRSLDGEAGFLERWADATTADVSLDGEHAGTLHLSAVEAGRMLASVEPVGAHGLADRERTLARLGREALRAIF
jgi:NTE family protein